MSEDKIQRVLDAAVAWRKVYREIEPTSFLQPDRELMRAIDALGGTSKPWPYTIVIAKDQPSVAHAGTGEVVCRCWTEDRARQIMDALNRSEAT